jgi:hypothetical protein
LFNPRKLGTDDLFMRRRAEKLIKASLHKPPRDTAVFRHFVDADAITGVLMDVLNRLRSKRVADRHDVG